MQKPVTFMSIRIDARCCIKIDNDTDQSSSCLLFCFFYCHLRWLLCWYDWRVSHSLSYPTNRIHLKLAILTTTGNAIRSHYMYTSVECCAEFSNYANFVVSSNCSLLLLSIGQNLASRHCSNIYYAMLCGVAFTLCGPIFYSNVFDSYLYLFWFHTMLPKVCASILWCGANDENKYIEVS